MVANTIRAFRVNQWGIEGVRAVGTLTIAEPVTNLDTFTIGATTYTLVTSGAVAGQINMGGSEANTKLNIVAAINGTDSLNAAHPAVSASAFSGDVCTITARQPGTHGNALAFSETFTDVTNVMNGSGFLGGTTPGSQAKGTAVAATSKISIEQIDWLDDDENSYMPQIANGLLIRNSGRAVAVQHGTRFSFSDQPMVWEQLPMWFAGVIEGEVVATVEAGPVYEFVYERAAAADPGLVSFTIQRRYSDGANYIDQRVAYAMLSEFGLKYAQNEHVRMSGGGFGRKNETSTITAALTLPDPQIGVSALSKVYIDDTWATVGDTLVAEQVIGWDWSLGTGLMPLHTAEGRTDLDFTKHLTNGEEVTIGFNLTCLLEPTVYAAERTAAAAGDVRAVRVRIDGGSGRQLDIDFLAQHVKPDLFNIGDQDGQDIVEMEMAEATDNENFLRVTLTHPTVGYPI